MSENAPPTSGSLWIPKPGSQAPTQDNGAERAHMHSPAIGKTELHHTLGGDVLRIGEPPKAPPSRSLVDRLRDFFMAW